ncbi:hypothetical protein NKH77_29430 [Streptomyces sp. M19]
MGVELLIPESSRHDTAIQDSGRSHGRPRARGETPAAARAARRRGPGEAPGEVRDRGGVPGRWHSPPAPPASPALSARPALSASPGSAAPPGPAAPPGSAAPPAPSVARLVGLDLARGLAVFGMYAAHVGPDPDRGGAVGWLMELSHGRSSALFAVLAGVSLVIIAGRRTPRTGRSGRQAAARS